MKRIITLIALAAIAFGANAQEKASKGVDKKDVRKTERSAFDSEHVAYLTAEMDLTTEEAQLFWPVYNKYAKEQRLAFKDYKTKVHALKEAVKGGDESAISTALNAVLDLKKKQKDTFAEHAAEIRQIVGPVKAARFYLAEENFRSRQMHRLGQMKGHGKHVGKKGGNKGDKPCRPEKDTRDRE